MIAYRWESAKRHYVALLYRDLSALGFCGGIGRTRQCPWHERCEPVADQTAGLATITRIDALRQRHGYQRAAETSLSR